MASGTQLRPYKCHMCPRSVNTAQGLKSHITRKHAVNVTPLPSGPSPSDSSFSCTPLQYGVGLPSDSSDSIQGASPEDILDHIRTNVKVLRRIPKGARGPAATALTDSLDACLEVGSLEKWIRLLQFPASCLRVPSLPEDTKTSLTSLVKLNIVDYVSGKAYIPVRFRNPRRSSTLDSVTRAKYVQAKLSDGDVKGAVRLLSSADSFAPDDRDTLEALKAHHPAPLPENRETPSVDDPRHTPLHVTSTEVLGAISSFPAGSAGGLDLLRPQHLKDLTGHSAGVPGKRLLSSLTKFCALLLNGNVPDHIRPIIYGASLCAFNKPKGGIRPIAIGSTYRRLVSKLCCLHLASSLGDYLKPLQHGFGSKRGLEVATHLTRRYVNSPHSELKVLLKVDFRNAFNSIHRSVLLKAVSHLAPEIYQYVHQCYGSPSILAFGESIISSARGVQQGDPLGPVLFCLVIQPLIETLQSELNTWYLDDGTLGGNFETVLQDFTSLKDKSFEVGLEINEAKCELYLLKDDPLAASPVLDAFRNIAPEIPLLPLQSCTQLGTPLFSSAVASHLQEKTQSLRLLTSRLRGLPAQCAFFVLKHSQAIPKFTHLLRCSPTWTCTDELEQIDLTIRDSLTSILNISLTPESWTQSSWPTSKGGLGIRHVRDLSLPAFLSSTYGTLSQVNSILPPALKNVPDDSLTAGTSLWESTTSSQVPPEDRRPIQKEWERPGLDVSIRTLSEQASNPLDKARLTGVSSAESGAFLNALPSSQLGTLLDDNSFRIAIALRLGSEICQPHTCFCGAMVTPNGIHGLSCMKSAGRLSRHSTVNDIIHRALSSAEVPSSLEPSHLALTSNIRPDGVTQIPWKNGKSLIWDFTCVDGLAPSHVEMSSAEPLAAARKAELAKHAKYEYLAYSHIFVPVAFECLGSVGKEGKAFLVEIGKRIQAATGDKRATTFLLQRISVEIQRGNARSIQGTLPTSSSLDDCLTLL